MNFKLKKDSLVKVWKREYFSIEANSLDEAMEKMKDYDNCYGENYMFETETLLDPIDNNDEATVEIFDDKGNLICSN